MSFEFRGEKQCKTSAHSLYDFCMRKIAKRFSILEKDVARLPYNLINDLYDNRNKYKMDSKTSRSKIFLNPGITHLDLFQFVYWNLYSISNLIICSNVTELILVKTIRICINKHIELIKNFPQLQKITLPGHSTDEMLSVIATHCPQLLYLNSVRCKHITDEGIGFLCSQENVKINYLNICRTGVKPNGCLRVLNTFKQLKVFKHDCWNEVMKHLKFEMESTEIIKPFNTTMNNYNYIFHKHFQVVVNYFPKVRTLRMFEPIDYNIPNALTFCSKIEKINYEGNRFYPDVRLIGHMFPKLKSLYLCCELSGRFQHQQDIRNAISHVPFRYLRQIYVKNVESVDDLYMLLSNCYNLEKLHIDGSVIFTDHFFNEMIKLNPLSHLKTLFITKCNRISTKSLLRVLEKKNCLNDVGISDCSLVNLQLLKDCLEYKNFNVKVRNF